MDRVGLVGAGNNIVSVKARGAYKRRDHLKTPDSQFIAATINRLFVVPKHIWSKVNDVANYTNANPVSSGPFNRITRFTSQDYVFSKNTSYWQKGKPKIRCLEYVQASSNDAALALIQKGQVDWTHNFVPNVEKAYDREGQEALPRVLLRRRRTRSRSSSTRRSTRTASPRSARRSASRSTARRCRSSASTATRLRPTHRPQRALPELGHRTPR